MASRRKPPALSKLAVADGDAGTTGGGIAPIGDLNVADGKFESGDVTVDDKGEQNLCGFSLCAPLFCAP
jgi:hypothetical protein